MGRPCLPPPPLPGQSLWSLRGAGAPTGRVRPAPSQKPGSRAGRLLCSGARREARDWLWVPRPGGAGWWGAGGGAGFSASLPLAPVREHQCQQRWGGDGSKLGPTSHPCLDHAGKQEVGRLHTAGEGPLERHCWGWGWGWGCGLRQGASERAQHPPTPKAHKWGVA